MKLKRLGIRRVLAKVGKTKLGKIVDTIVSATVIKLEGVLNTISEKSGLNKVKVNIVSGNRKSKKNNNSILAKLEQVEKNTVEQEARDIQSKKDFEREKENDILALGVGYKFETKRVGDEMVLKEYFVEREGLCVTIKLSDTKRKIVITEGDRL